MNRTLVRLLVGAATLLLIYGTTYLLRAGMRPPRVEFPDRDFTAMPLRFGDWEGESVKLDERTFARIGADVVVDRCYRKRGEEILAHLAVFSDPLIGAYHSPVNCYRGAGWQRTDSRRVDLPVSPERTIPVSISTWQRENEQIMVLYWFQLDDYIIFGRGDMLGARWALRGREVWPPLIKVLMQTQAYDALAAERRLLDLAGQMHAWVNEGE